MSRHLPGIIDLHEDISLNIRYATQKDFGVRNELHQGNSPVGFAVNNNIDLPRLREGNVRAVFGAIFGVTGTNLQNLESEEKYNFEKVSSIKTGLPGVIDQLGVYYQLASRFPRDLRIIHNYNEYQSAVSSNRIGIILHLEGIDFLNKEPDLLGAFISLGIRSVAFTWRNKNRFGSGNNTKGGLQELGRETIDYLHRNGVIFDLAHVNEQTFFEAAEVMDWPFIVSHTLCRGIVNNTRNISDQQIKLVAEKGGVIGLAPITAYLGGNRLVDYVAHFVYIKKLVGADYIAFGTDFDGMIDKEDEFIDGFEDVSKFPNLIEALDLAGFSEEDIEKICHTNVERVMSEVMK